MFTSGFPSKALLACIAAALAAMAVHARQEPSGPDAQPPRAKADAPVDPAVQRLMALGVVALPLDEGTLRNCMTAVGLRAPGGDAGRALASAVKAVLARAAEQRAAFEADTLRSTIDSLAKEAGTQEPLSSAAIERISKLRRRALEIDLQVVEDVAASLENAKDPARRRLTDALRDMVRIDAAVSTMDRIAGLPIPFLSVGPGLQSINLASERGLVTRDLLIADLQQRAEAAEVLSLASLQISSSDRSAMNTAIQMSVTSLLAQGVTVDPELLRVLSALMVLKPAVKPATTLVGLDAELVRSLVAALSPSEAADVLIALDPRAMRGGTGPLDIRRMCAEAALLKGATPEQLERVQRTLEEWQRTQLTAYQSVLDVDSRWLKDAQQLTDKLKADDSATWQLNPPSATVERLAKEIAQRREQSKASKQASERARDQMKEILGAELWRQLEPPPSEAGSEKAKVGGKS